jgi:hypothetical protein
MNAGTGIVPEHDPQLGGNILLQITKDHIQTAAIRTLVIPILDERIRGILRTFYVVQRTNRKQEAGKVGGIHKGLCVQHRVTDVPNPA